MINLSLIVLFILKINFAFSATQNLALNSKKNLKNSGQSSGQSQLEKCLGQKISIQTCIKRHLPNVSIESCFSQTRQIKSNFLKEEVRKYCFFQVSEFPTLGSCIQKADLFITAEYHDEALFECYRQHQKTITFPICSEVAEKLRYPEKSKYLSRHCETLQE